MLGYILEHQVFTQCLWTGNCLLSGLRLPGALGPNIPIFGPKRGEEAGMEAPDQARPAHKQPTRGAPHYLTCTKAPQQPLRQMF